MHTKIVLHYGLHSLITSKYAWCLRVAAQLKADKLFNVHMDEVTKLNLPQWLPLSDAQNMLMRTLQVNDVGGDAVVWWHVQGKGGGLYGTQALTVCCKACGGT